MKKFVKVRTGKRILSVFLAMLMLVSMLSVGVLSSSAVDNVTDADEAVEAEGTFELDTILFDYYFDNQVDDPNSPVTQGDSDGLLAIPYTKFNKAVANYFRAGTAEDANVYYNGSTITSKEFTPLYFGDLFNKTSDMTSSSYFNYLRLANVANTADTHAAAMGLVDNELNENGELMQNGRVMPYFSEQWFDENRDTSSVAADYVTFEFYSDAAWWNNDGTKTKRTIANGNNYTFRVDSNGWTNAGSNTEGNVKVTINAANLGSWGSKPTKVRMYINKVADGSGTGGDAVIEKDLLLTTTGAVMSHELADDVEGNAYAKIYKDLKFPVNTTTNAKGTKVYSYNSSTDGNRYYDAATNTIQKGANVYGMTSTDTRSSEPGYFPFNKTNPSTGGALNYGNGTQFTIPFYMTEDGKINGEDITFNFTGDDDVWVFVDGKLVLDLGGGHLTSEGEINFATGTSTVKKGMLASYSANTDKTAESKAVDSNLTYNFKSLIPNLYDTSQQHTLTMYHMERGMYDSNMSLNFTLPQYNTLDIRNTLDASKVNNAFKSAAYETADEDAFAYNLSSDSNPTASRDSKAVYPNATGFVRDIAGEETGISEPKKTILEVPVEGDGKVYHFPATGVMQDVTDTSYIWGDRYADSSLGGSQGVGLISDTVKGGRSRLYLQYGQNALFTNEFEIGSSMKLEQKEVLNSVLRRDTEGVSYEFESVRNVSDYYNTSWKLHDYKALLGQGSSSVVSDNERDSYTEGQFEINKTDKSGDINANLVAEFVNEIKTADLVISKELDIGDRNTEFSFKVEFGGIFGGRLIDYESFDGLEYTTSSGGDTIYTLDKGETLKLKAGESATIIDVPVGTAFRVTEVDLPEGFYTAEIKADETVSTSIEDGEAAGSIGLDGAQVTLDYVNTNVNYTVVYRYHPRIVENGKPTIMDNENYLTISRKIPNLDKKTIIDYAPLLTNILDTYSLSYDDVEINTDDETAVATFINKPKEYSVEYFVGDTSRGIFKYYNELITKEDGVIAPSKNENGKDFMYWGSLQYTDPVTEERIWTPVSTQNPYQYRVVQNLTIRAIYEGDMNPITGSMFPAYTYGVNTSDVNYDAYTTDDNVNRVRGNVFFNPVGVPDTDKEISQIGYVRVNSYSKYDTSVTQDQLRDFIENGTPIYVENGGKKMAATKAQYTVTNYLEAGETEYPEVEQGKVTLTNKNRANFVFDMQVKDSNLEKYYTIYTYMYRDGTLYISPTAAFVNLKDAPKKGDPYKPDQWGVYVSVSANDYALGKATTNKAYVIYGQKVKFTATPADPFKNADGNMVYPEFDKWIINGREYDTETVEYPVESYSNVEAKAYFKESSVLRYTIKTSGKLANGFGSAYLTAIDGNAIENSESVNLLAGQTVTFTATANSGYRFVKWSNGDTNPVYTYTVPSDGSAENFELMPEFENG